jgi:lysophospholipase L1-like esterase
VTARRAVGAATTFILTLCALVAASAASSRLPALVVYGHSYVAGHRGSTEAPWPELVAHDLGYRLVNRGHGGDLLDDTVGRVHDVPGAGVLVILETGLNDVREHGTDPASLKSFEAELRALVERLSSRGAEVHVAVDGGLADWHGQGRFTLGSDEAMAAYRAAARNVGEVIDLSTGWDPETMLGPDRVHPNAAGVHALADMVEAALR